MEEEKTLAAKNTKTVNAQRANLFSDAHQVKTFWEEQNATATTRGVGHNHADRFPSTDRTKCDTFDLLTLHHRQEIAKQQHGW